MENRTSVSGASCNMDFRVATNQTFATLLMKNEVRALHWFFFIYLSFIWLFRSLSGFPFFLVYFLQHSVRAVLKYFVDARI